MARSVRKFRRFLLFGVCVPLLLLSLLSLTRTLVTGVPDLILVGYAPRWWSFSFVTYWLWGTEIQVNEATRWPPLLGESGPFVRHFQTFGITHEVGQLSDRPDRIDNFDVGIYQSLYSYKEGTLMSCDYRIVLPGFGPVITIFSAMPFVFLLSRRLRARRAQPAAAIEVRQE